VLADICTLNNFLALIIVCAGGLVRGYTGFGSNLVMVPLLSLIWSPAEAVAMTMGISIVTAAQMAPGALPLANKREIVPMIAGMILCTPLGTYLLLTLDQEVTKNIIAGFVLLLTLITLRGWQYTGPRSVITSLTAGGVGGVITGVAGVGGPPIVLYVLALKEEVTVQRANIIVLMAFMGTFAFVYLILGGEVGVSTLTRIVFCIIPSVASVWIGMRLFNILPSRAFRLMVLWMLIVISIMILVL
jgi:uncharacterized membrane protein YfcA